MFSLENQQMMFSLVPCPSPLNHNSTLYMYCSKGIFSMAQLLVSISRLNNCCRANSAAVNNQNLKEMEAKSQFCHANLTFSGPQCSALCSGWASISEDQNALLIVGWALLWIKDDNKINLLLTEREGHTGEYWPEVVAVWTERSKVHTKTTEGQYSPVRLKQARLVSSLLYGTRVMLVSKLPAFENKKCTSYDHFHGNARIYPKTTLPYNN